MLPIFLCSSPLPNQCAAGLRGSQLCDLPCCLPDQALSREEQAARVQRWAELDEGPKLSDALAGLPAETQKRVADLRTTLQVLRIQQVRGCVLALPPQV